MTLRKLSILWLVIWIGASATVRLALGPGELDLSQSLGGPVHGHWLGFDPLGRDLLRVLLQSSATSLGFAGLTVALSTVGALAAGLGMAAAPGGLRFALLRALDAVLAFPALLLALAWAALRGPGWSTLLVCLLLSILPSFTRLLYARARELMALPYVLAARSMGAREARVLRCHLAPALISLCGVKLPFLIAQALLAEATLSFLGVGAPIGRPSWGALLAAARDYLFEAPHLAIGTGLPLVLCILALQALSSD